jgi:hypothetical protein
MRPTSNKFNDLIKTIESGKYQKNVKKQEKIMAKHVKFKNLAIETFQKAMDPACPEGKRYYILQDTWGHCFNALKFYPRVAELWELMGDSSFERAEPHVALLAYRKVLEMQPTEEERIKKKILEVAQLRDLFLAMDNNLLPISILLNILKCVNCGAIGDLIPLRVTKNYTTTTGAIKYRIHSEITVPLCLECMTKSKKNATRNISYHGREGAVVRVAKGWFLFDLWKKMAVLQNYKVGYIDPEVFSFLNSMSK